jgi:signal transduction histidine kinase
VAVSLTYADQKLRTLPQLGVSADVMNRSLSEQRASIRAMSRYAANEIRLVLTSFTYLKHGAPISLLAALSTLGEQTTFALDQIGTQNMWRISALHRVTVVDPRICLELSRIMQEAIHNATVRGKATTLLITADVIDDQRVELTVRNEGGKAIELPTTQMCGIATMHVRAASIEAEISISSLPTGAVLSLVAPLGANFMLDQAIAPSANKFAARSTS